MKRTAWVFGACLLGGLWVAAVYAGLQSPVRAAEQMAPAAEPGDVVINEVAWGGTAASTSDEWIELYNNTTATVVLTGWRLYSSDGKPDLALTGEIPPLGYYLIERSDDNTVRDIPADWIGSFGSSTGAGLSNDGEVLTLTDHLGNVLDTANADGGAWPAGSASPTYRSMERVDPTGVDTNTNWLSNTVAIRNGLDANGNPINGTPKCRNSVSSPAADLAVEFGGVPAQVSAGDRLTYTIRFRNAGNIVAASVWLTDALPAGLTFFTQTSPYTFSHPNASTLLWQVGDLPISTTLSVITITVDVDGGISGMLTNVITATTIVTEAADANNTALFALAVYETPPLLADLSVAKSGPLTATPGSVITYRIALSNTGAVTAIGVRLTDTLPASVAFITQTSAFAFAPSGGVLVWDAGDVLTGVVHLITVTARVSEMTSGALVNVVTGTTTASETVTVNNSAVWTTTVVIPPPAGVADLSVAKSGPLTATPGSVITYRIALSNTGAVTATGVQLTDTLPAGVALITQTSAFAFAPSGGALVWDAGDVLTGAVHLITVTARVSETASGVLVNVVTATTTTGEALTANNTAGWPITTVVAHNPRDVVINEVAWMGTDANANHEWIELHNVTGGQIDLNGWRLGDHDGVLATLTGTIPAGGYYLLVRYTATFTTTLPQIDQLFSGNLRNDGEAITLTDSNGVVIDTANIERGYDSGWAAGNSTIPRCTMERIDPAASDADANWCTNDGVTRNGLDANGAPINGTPKARNSCYQPPATPTADLSVAKAGPATVSAGNLITYRIALSNAGAVTATGVRLTDALPAGVEFITQTSVFAFAPSGGVLVWDAGDVPTGVVHLITVTARVSETASGVLVNVITATTMASETVTVNNSAVWTTTVVIPPPAGVADLSIAKSGPLTATPGSVITYRIALSNTGAVTATGVRLTDTLPAGVEFITQTGPFVLLGEGPLVWDAGDVLTGAVHLITVTACVSETASGVLVNVITATTTASETTTANNRATWTTAVSPRVLLYALAPANYGGSGEAIALINLNAYGVALDGWCLDDNLSPAIRACFPAGAQIAPGQILWLAQNADGFYPVWGFDADRAITATLRPVPLLSGGWPGFSDAGAAVYLLDGGGNVVDALAYGSGSAVQGWSGPAVPYKYAGYADGQVLYRKLDQATRLPVPDSDTAADWAQDPADPINGRKLRYPGWDLEALFFPAEITASANVTLAVAPDGAFDLVSRTIASAQHSLRVEAYTLESFALYQVISDRIRAGVTVTILLESGPTGGMNNAEKWIARQLHNPPTSTIYFIGRTAARYRFQHSKFILVDDRLALVSTDNLGENGMPSDRKDNGTLGHRGFVAVTDSPGVVARLAEVFRRDCDSVHRDVAPYSTDYAPPSGFTPLPPPDWTTYTASFSVPLAATADHFTVLHAPEHALRDRDSLLGLLGQTASGDQVAVMQLNEPFTWTAGAGDAGLNPRLQALVAAARRGASVRVLLDEYYDDGSNITTCLTLNGVAAQESISLTCRLANVTGLGIHAKVFLVSANSGPWVHLGSINGTETSSKANREVALQFRSPEAYEYLLAVFDHDWARAHGPMVHHVYLPLVLRDYVSPAGYPLIVEILINPDGDDAGKEWIELYNPGPDVSIAGWTLGDAINVGDYGDGRYAFPAGVQFLRGQTLVAAACATNFAAAYGRNPNYEWMNCSDVPDLVPVGAWDGFGLALGNESDEVLLLDGSGALVDSVAWGGAPRAGVIPFTAYTTTFPSGASLRRYPPDSDRNDCVRDFYIDYSPMPK